MRAVTVHRYGGNEVVECIDVPRPVPACGEVLVKVHAAGVNPVDWKIRAGMGVRLGLSLPIRLGGEFAGTVEAVGSDVVTLRVGDAVFGIIPSGAFAEYAVARADALVSKPRALDFVESAALPLGALTAWQAMFDLGGLSAGQRLLIIGGAGGVGSLAVQLAKSHGAEVTAVASGRNEAFVRALGVDAFIDYTKQPFDQVARDMDLVFDTVGGDSHERGCRTLKPGGTIVSAVAFPGDEAQRYGIHSLRVFCKADAGQLHRIRDLAERGLVVPHVETVLPLEAVRAALVLSEGGRTRGKIVLRMPP